MSAGPRIRVGYQSSSSSGIHPLDIQPETLTLRIGGLFNSSATPINRVLSPTTGGSGRRRGLNTRMVHFKFAPGAAPAGYAQNGSHSLPWLTNNSAFASLVPGRTGRYLSASVIFTGKTGETVG